MAFRTVETIKIGKLSPGRFAGGFIYGANFVVGGVGGVSKLTLSVVDEGPDSRFGDTEKYDGLKTKRTRTAQGILNSKGEDLSVRKGDEFDIEIGNINLKMSLIAYSEEKTPEQHTMTFDFVDTSHILDRVFIGLPNRHQKAQAKEQQYLLKDLEALCPNCFTGAADRKVKVDNFIALRDAAFHTKSGLRSRTKGMEVNWQTNPTTLKELQKKGGIITLGREEFIDHGSSGFKPLYTKTEKQKIGNLTVTINETIGGEVPCDIPNVSYKFIDLLSAIKNGLGIQIKGFKDPESYMGKKDLDWESKGLQNDYRQTYTGTLREVLNNWCADFGYGFVWDFPEKGDGDSVITFIDLKYGVYKDFHQVKNIIEDFDLSKTAHSEDPVLISQMSYSKSMEETYSHNYLSYYLKPNRVKTFNPFAYYMTKFYCLRVNDVFSAAGCGIPNNDAGWNNFLISCALAKYDSSARKVFNASIGRWHAIGITICHTLSEAAKNEVFSLLDGTDLSEVLAKYNFDAAAPNVDAAVAIVNDDANSEWEQFEAAVADEFLGKHYVANPIADYGFDMAEFEACFPALNYKQKVEFTPNANKLTNTSEVPWANLAARSPVAMRGGNTLLATWMNATWVRHLYHFEIGAEWGTSQDQVDFVMKNNLEERYPGHDYKKGKDIESALGFYDSLADSGVLWNNLAVAQNSDKNDYRNLGDIFRSINHAGNGYALDSGNAIGSKAEIPKLLVFSRKYVDNVLQFKVGPAPQSLPNPYADLAKSQVVAAAECSIRCESGLLETICKCPTDQQLESLFRVGLDGNLAPTAFMRYRCPPIPLIFPVNSGISGGYVYYGFAKRSNEIKAVMNGTKMVLGDLGGIYNENSHKTINSPLLHLPENAMSIRVTAQDITNDADLTSEALFKQGQKRDDGVLDATPKLINVLVPDAKVSNGQVRGRGGEKMTSLENYHKSIKQFITSQESGKETLIPTETFSFSMLGTDYNIGGDFKINKLKTYLTPSKGMTSFNVSFGQEGLTSSFTFSTRPSQLPKQETTMRKIGPTAWKSWYS